MLMAQSVMLLLGAAFAACWAACVCSTHTSGEAYSKRLQLNWLQDVSCLSPDTGVDR